MRVEGVWAVCSSARQSRRPGEAGEGSFWSGRNKTENCQAPTDSCCSSRMRKGSHTASFGSHQGARGYTPGFWRELWLSWKWSRIEGSRNLGLLFFFPCIGHRLKEVIVYRDQGVSICYLLKSGLTYTPKWDTENIDVSWHTESSVCGEGLGVLPVSCKTVILLPASPFLPGRCKLLQMGSPVFIIFFPSSFILHFLSFCPFSSERSRALKRRVRKEGMVKGYVSKEGHRREKRVRTALAQELRKLNLSLRSDTKPEQQQQQQFKIIIALTAYQALATTRHYLDFEFNLPIEWVKWAHSWCPRCRRADSSRSLSGHLWSRRPQRPSWNLWSRYCVASLGHGGN